MTAGTWGSAITAAGIAAGISSSGLSPLLGIGITSAVVGGLGAWHWRRRAAQRQRQRDEHLAHTAHELRSPLASILTALELVRSGFVTTPAETAEFLAEAELAARHLAFLVNDVLDETALSTGRLRLQLGDHELGDLLREGAQVLGLQAERRGITVHWPVPPPGVRVRADAHRCLQVLFNLVGNAIKFSAPGQPVRIEWERRADRIRIAVVDAGPGVPVKLQAQMFRPFASGESTTTAASTGLGLFLVKQLVLAMGGAVGFASGVGRGSCFWFELVAAARPEAAIAQHRLLPR